MQIEDYVKAGKIAAEVREMVRVKDWIGKSVYEICEEVEGEIKKRGGLILIQNKYQHHIV